MEEQAGVTGAQALVGTLLGSGVDVCFANPGTSEMHFVAALDHHPGMRAVLCLFEGVATGAADGYGRMARRPAATLLHLGPGLANGIANLHNARRAHTPVVNVVGDHATAHKPLDAPLESDVLALAGTVSRWVTRPATPEDVGRDASAAVAAALGHLGAGFRGGAQVTGTSGSVATLVVPADVSWSPGGFLAPPLPVPAADSAPEDVLVLVRSAMRAGPSTVLLLGGSALGEEGLCAASRLQRATGVRLLAEAFPARLRRGAGVPGVERLGYRGEDVTAQLGQVEHLVLVGARAPVTAFAYPGREGSLTPPGARVHHLAAQGGTEAELVLVQLADELAAGVEPGLTVLDRPVVPHGPLTNQTWVQVIGALLPDEAIISDESITAGMGTLEAATAGAPAHDVLTLTGLAIGQGLPVGVGAAVACPQRPVVCLQADGSAMYTISALWSHAREGLDITTVVLNNRSYAILAAELARVGASSAGGGAAALFDLTGPDLDFVALAQGMGVPATRATTCEQLAAQFTAALAAPGPHLIDAVLTP